MAPDMIRRFLFHALQMLATFFPVALFAADELPIPSSAKANTFIDDAKITGGIYYFQRDRRRYDIESGHYETNLEHGSLQSNLDVSSGFFNGVAGFDFAVFASADAFNRGAVDHEMNFVPWSNPWEPDWNKTHTKDGVSIYKAAIKLRAGNGLWTRAGYLQPEGPGVMGVNWSIMPGTYRGLNAGFDSEALSVAMAWADQYKAPWYTGMSSFRKNDGKTDVPWMWSLGAKYKFKNGLILELGYGESKRHLAIGHLKSSYAWVLSDKNRFTLGYHLYAVNDSDDSGKSLNDNFDALATQHYLFGKYETPIWLFRLEGTYTEAPFSNKNHAGYFVYRMTDRNGSSKGAYDIWWNARSDWNADNEKAAFAGVERKLDDLFAVKGFYIGAGFAYGFGGRAFGTSTRLREKAYTADVGYVKPMGPMKGAFAKLHLTEYRNKTGLPSWDPFKNAFQSERDIILFLGVPLAL